MLSIRCTQNNNAGRVYELTDSATGMKCEYHDTAPHHDTLNVWIQCNVQLIVARMQIDTNFVGDTKLAE